MTSSRFLLIAFASTLIACGDAGMEAEDQTPSVADTAVGEHETGSEIDSGIEPATDSGSAAADTKVAADTKPPEPIPGPKLKVMTFNIRVGTAADGPNEWSLRKGLVFKVFENEDADLVGLQEDLGFQLNAIGDNVTGYKRFGVGAKDGKDQGEHCAIMYRASAFTLKDSGTFWLSNTPNVPGSVSYGNDGFPRIVTWGRFAVKDTGYEFYLYNSHFDHLSQNSREKSALQLMNKIAKRSPKAPFIVTGDLNVHEDNLVTKYFKGNAKIDGEANSIPLFDTFRVLYPDEANARTAHGFTGGIVGDKIDYIYLQTKNVLGAHINHFNVDGRYPSDHYPVVATVKLPSDPAVP